MCTPFCLRSAMKHRVTSEFCVRSPYSKNLLPTLTHQVLLHPLCLFPQKVLTGFQQSRRPIGYRTTHIHKNPGFPDPCLFVPVEPIGPSVFGIHQPSLCHTNLLAERLHLNVAFPSPPSATTAIPLFSTSRCTTSTTTRREQQALSQQEESGHPKQV